MAFARIFRTFLVTAVQILCVQMTYANSPSTALGHNYEAIETALKQFLENPIIYPPVVQQTEFFDIYNDTVEIVQKEVDPEIESIPKNCSRPPRDLKDVFLKLEKFLFHKNGVLQLLYCQGENSETRMLYTKSTIVIDQNMHELMGRDLNAFTFILAHEISHWIQYSWYYRHRRSPSGYVMDFYAQHTKEQYENGKVDAFFKHLSLVESETDILAALILQRLYPEANPVTGVQSLKSSVSILSRNQKIALRVRVEEMQKFLKMSSVRSYLSKDLTSLK